MLHCKHAIFALCKFTSMRDTTSQLKSPRRSTMPSVCWHWHCGSAKCMWLYCTEQQGLFTK